MTSLELRLRVAFVSLGQSLVRGGQLVVALVLVRLLPPQQWAAMALLLSIYLAVLGIGTLNIQQSVFFFYGRVSASERRKLAVQTATLLAASGALSAVVVVLLQPILDDSAFAVEGALVWLALALFLEIPTLGCSQLLLAAERAAGAAVYDGVMAAMQVGALVIPVALGYGPHEAMIGLCGYAAIRLIASGVVVLRLFPHGKARLDWSSMVEQVLYVAPLALTMATAVLNRSLDKWIVAGLATEDFGAYAVAAQEVPLIAIIPYAVGAVLATRLVHAFQAGNVARVRAYWLAQVSRMSLLVVPASVGLIVCSREIIALLFTEVYAAATLPFQIYSLILLHRVAEYGLVLRAAGRTKDLWWSSLVLLLTNTIFSLVLTLWLGMVGAALGTVLANLIAWIYVLAKIADATETTIRAVFPWGLYGRAVALAFAGAVLAAAIASHFQGPLLATLAVKGGVYAALVAWGYRLARLRHGLPAVPGEDEAFVREVVHG